MVGAKQPVHSFLRGKGLEVEANQPVHYFLGGKALGSQQVTSVWVGSPESFVMMP